MSEYKRQFNVCNRYSLSPWTEEPFRNLLSTRDNPKRKYNKVTVKVNFDYQRHRELRLNNNLSVLEVSLMIGLSTSTIKKFETGKLRKVEPKTVDKLKLFYKINDKELRYPDED